MKLKSLEYVQFEGKPNEWRLKGLTLGPINLLVGKNATGKTRTLSIIINLAKLLSDEIKPTFSSGHYTAMFDHDGKELRYELEYTDAKVVREALSLDSEKLLERGERGEGKIYAEKEKRMIDFQPPDDQLAAVARRDAIQHKFFEPLHEWGKSLSHYLFGSTMGQHQFAVMKGENIKFDPKDTNAVVAVFNKGELELGERFKNAIKEDMKSVGYPLDRIGTASPSSITLPVSLASEFVGLYVKESSLNDDTDQIGMSQGMFRALSIIIQLNYSDMARTPSCILIDDIGEGLDFERSCDLIDLLMRKAEESSVQLVMATNDRFVMNRVPLETWSVLHREGGTVRVSNYDNSRERFDQFKFTGLNNFDFFAVDFINQEAAANE